MAKGGTRKAASADKSKKEDSASWYKDAVVYELHVKAFKDSAGDGVGDFKGLTSKLGYLQDLGVTAIWLLPFYPSPLLDDGYDISDYFGVHKLYGELGDFKDFLREAHSRGIKVITELVVNHTSSRHEWFARARRSPPGSNLRDFYVWSGDPRKYSDARIIFKDTEASNWTWDPVAKAYYWHRFYSHQPDLNFDNPEVEKAIFKVMDYWLKMGVDGLRLDAVPYLYEREGTNCENLPETHALLKRIRKHVDSKFKDKMLLAEANQWPSDAAKYFGEGDECNMAFHFPLMPRMFMAIQMEDRFPVVEILEETPAIPRGCQWAIFLRNHDELTLEMVTDEERDYMYRAYAHDREARINLGIRRRLAPLLGNDRRKIELINVLLFTLPGTPVLYYGDEIGMGDNFYLGDRNGVRTPMQWSADMNAGFSRANPQKLYLPVVIDPKYHYASVNVENQLGDSSSLLWWFKRVVFMRKRFKSLGRGSIRFLFPDTEKVIAYVRSHEDESMLVVANLSKKPQAVELDLSGFEGYSPQEVMGGSQFPEIKSAPYRLTLGAYGYFVFSLARRSPVRPEGTASTVELLAERTPREIFDDRHRAVLESTVLPFFLYNSRWFGGKARLVEGLAIRDVVESTDSGHRACYNLIIDVNYSEGMPESYFIPVSYMDDKSFSSIPDQGRPKVLARVTFPSETGVIYDATADPAYCRGLLQSLLGRRPFQSPKGRIEFYPTPWFRRAYLGSPPGEEVRIQGGEQSNSTLLFGEDMIVKVMRRVEDGIQPEVEIGKYLTESAFPFSPPLLGHVQYQPEEGEPTTLVVVEGYVRNQGDAWKLFTTEFETFAEEVSHGQHDRVLTNHPHSSDSAPSQDADFSDFFEVTGPLFREKVSILAKRTAEFHIALAGDTDDPNFAPEPFGYLGQVSLSQEMVGAARRTLQFIERVSPSDESRQKDLSALLSRKDDVMRVFGRLKAASIDSVKCRIQGDYHLGQDLYTGKDFVIIDYDGEPARSLSERRLKRSPLRDVAGMLRSFHYVAVSTLLHERGARHYADYPKLGEWTNLWYLAVASTFLKAYLDGVKGTSLVPKDRKTLAAMLDAYLLEKALYELTYELNSRPDWIGIPLEGIAQILGPRGGQEGSRK